MDAGWYFSSDWGRDQRLRKELEEQAEHTARTSARLRSQLTRVQGSLERRITALATAFDAYVELGDVREELAELPSSAPVRRRARDAMATLRAGHNPTPLPEGQAGHWLGGAMNRVIAAVRREVPLPTAGTGDAGRAGDVPDGPGADRVLTGSRDARIFEALALGSLGAGARAVDTLPALLTTDGGFTIEQAVLFLGVMDGKFGDHALAGVRSVMAGNLARSEQADWDRWLVEQAGRGTVGILEWAAAETLPLSDLPAIGQGAQPIDVAGYTPAGPGATGDAEAKPDTDEMFDRLVTEMIQEGSPLERELIHRAVVLRARIEDPDAATPVPRWEHDPISVATAVRDAFVGSAVGSPERRELFGWILPHVRDRIEEALQPDEEAAVVLKARTPGGTVDVRETGPDSSQMARARASIAERHARPPINRALVITAGVLVVAAVVGMVTLGPQGWLFVPLVVAAILVGRAVWLIRPGDRAQQRDRQVAEIDAEVDKTRRMVATVMEGRAEERRDRERVAEQLRGQLAAFDGEAGPVRDADAAAR